MITKREGKKIQAEFHTKLVFEFICGRMPAENRLALLRQEMSTLDKDAGDDLLESVLGRLDHDDPLVLLMTT